MVSSVSKLKLKLSCWKVIQFRWNLILFTTYEGCYLNPEESKLNLVHHNLNEIYLDLILEMDELFECDSPLFERDPLLFFIWSSNIGWIYLNVIYHFLKQNHRNNFIIIFPSQLLERRTDDWHSRIYFSKLSSIPRSSSKQPYPDRNCSPSGPTFSPGFTYLCCGLDTAVETT